MAKKQSDVPAGFRLESDTTKVGDLEYAVEYLQIPTDASGLEALRAYYEAEGHDPDAVIAGIWNSANKQGATQSPKTTVRNAQDAGEGVDEAVAEAQEATRTHVIGAPRQRTGGYTKTAARNMGEEIARRTAEKGEALSPDELAEIYAEFGPSA